MNNTKKDQLFDLLTELDNKYYEEAIGGDPQKPLRIDVSRKPVKWYRIAAPIAACLVIGAGIIAAPRILNNIQGSTSEPESSVSDPAVSVSEPVTLPEHKDYYDLYPMIDLEKVPMLKDTNSATADNTVDMTLSVAKYGEYDVCVTGDGIFRIDDDVFTALCLQKLSLSLVKDGEVLSNTILAGNDDPNSFYNCTAGTQQPAIYEFSDCAVAIYEQFFSIKNEKISLLSGRMLDTYDVNTYYYIEFAEIPMLEQQGNSLINKQGGHEYRFSFDTFGDTSGEAENFTELLYETGDEPIDNISDYYPMFKPNNLPTFDSEPSDAEKSTTMLRGMVNSYTIEKDDSKNYDDLTKVALVAKHLYRINGEDDLTIHGDDLTFIMYKNNKILKEIKLAPSYDQTTIHMSWSVREKHHVFDGYTVFIVNSSCFAALTDEGELVLLKGLMPDGTLGCAVTPIEEMEELVQTGNSLFDVTHGIEYRFSPEMFKYADPSTEQAHFKVIADISEFNSKLTNGHVYNNKEENIPIPDVSGYNKVLGTQADLDRWNSFINSIDPPIITFVSTGGSKQMDTNKELYITFNTIRTAKFGLLEEFPDPSASSKADNSDAPPLPAGGGESSDTTGRRAPEIFSFDSDGTMLFSLYFHGEEYVQVTFDGSQDSYFFNAEGSGISSAGNYM